MSPDPATGRYHRVTYEVTVLVPSDAYRPAESVSVHDIAARCATGAWVATLPRPVESTPLRSLVEISGLAQRFGFTDAAGLFAWAKQKAGLARASHPPAPERTPDV